MPGQFADHDRAPATPDREPASMALADALARVRLRGAIFLRGEYTEAWAYESMPPRDAAAILAPGTRRLLLFHVVASGRCWIETDGERHWANGGDVIVLPYNDEHRMGGTADAALVSIATLLDPPPWDRMPVIRHGEGGTTTSVVCGYLICEDAMFDPRMKVFPSVFVVSPSAGPARDWVLASINYALQQTAQTAVDPSDASTRVPELLLAEVIKLHLSNAPAAEHGWVRALHDPVLAPALAAIHGSPDRKWSVVTLARKANVSPSLLDERFRDVLGLAPIRYLTGWRMRTAEDLLRTSDLSLGAVARRVGYESEEAFSRAFKRAHAQAPSAWRVQGPH